MRWLVALLVSAVMTMLLLDLGLFERERFFIADIATALPVIGWPLPFIGSVDAADASADARLMISTITIIVLLYFALRALLELLPPRWFTPDNGRVSRLPDPRLLRDRVRTQESNSQLKKLVHVTNGVWMAPLATILMFFLLVSLPVALLDRAYYWVWGLSLLVPITFYCCALNPDRPRKITMTAPELKHHLTPRSLPDDQPRRMRWRRVRNLLQMRAGRLRDGLGSAVRRGRTALQRRRSAIQPQRPTFHRGQPTAAAQGSVPSDPEAPLPPVWREPASEPTVRQADPPAPSAASRAADRARQLGTSGWSRLRDASRTAVERTRRSRKPDPQAESDVQVDADNQPVPDSQSASDPQRALDGQPDPAAQRDSDGEYEVDGAPEVDGEPAYDSHPEVDAEPDVDSEPEEDAEPEVDTQSAFVPEEAMPEEPAPPKSASPGV